MDLILIGIIHSIIPAFIGTIIGFLVVYSKNYVFTQNKKLNKGVKCFFAFIIGASIAGVPIAIISFDLAENTERVAGETGGHLIEGIYIGVIALSRSFFGILSGGIGGVWAERISQD